MKKQPMKKQPMKKQPMKKQPMKKQPMTEQEQLIHNIKKRLMNSYYGRYVFKTDS